MKLFFLMLLASCSVDAYGVHGTRFMLAEMQKARTDGTLACAVAFSRRTRTPAFDIGCAYAPEEHICTCKINSVDRFSEKIFPAFQPEVSFRVDPCLEQLPEGLEFPLSPSFVQTLRELRMMAAEIGLDLPEELRK